MKAKPSMILVTVSCVMPDGQVVRSDRMVERYKIESAHYTMDVLGYEALGAFKHMDKQLDELAEPATV